MPTPKSKLRSLKQVYLDRLQKLADHLEFGQLAHVEFNFADYNGIYSHAGVAVNRVGEAPIPGCGTVGCAIGECPAVFKQWTFRGNNICSAEPVLKDAKAFESPLISGARFFGLKLVEARHLFYPHAQLGIYGGTPLARKATKEEVAKNIRAFLYTLKTKPWSATYDY
jgi:hypothetical protein